MAGPRLMREKVVPRQKQDLLIQKAAEEKKSVL